MNTHRHSIALLLFALALPLLVIGCGSSLRTTVDGYDDSMLNGKRIFILLPKQDELILLNSSAYADSRGIVADGAHEMLAGEIRLRLMEQLDHRLDSNAVYNYASEPVGGIVPLTSSDFNEATPKDWDKIAEAGREANIDYMVVLYKFTMESMPSRRGRGDEEVSSAYSLLDVTRRKVMASGNVSAQIKTPNNPSETYQAFAKELTRKLPFEVSDK